MVIILEGLDRTGKSTQTEKIKEFFKKKGIETSDIHYEGIQVPVDGIFKQGAQEVASRARYDDMLKIADTLADVKNYVLIFDRAHLGEYVYSPMYRHYDGSYVFEMETHYPNFIKQAIELVFIDTVDNLIKRDDGLSFSIKKDDKEKEIQLFKEAFDKSNVKHKVLIDISKNDIEAVWNIIKPYLEKT